MDKTPIDAANAVTRSKRSVSRRKFLSTAFKTGVILSLDVPFESEARETSAQHFSIPALPDLPKSARPWVYWFWFNGDVTREGITADLEAMHQIGIGGAIVLCTGFGSDGPVRYMSSLWFDINHHTLAEAKRLGMQIDLNNDDGWSDAAGPWIPPEHAMQKLVWTESLVEGGKRFVGLLPQPETKRDFYREVRTIAIPAPLAYGMQLPPPTVSALPGKPSFIVHDYGKLITARSAEMHLFTAPAVGPVPIVFDLQCSADGEHFETIYHFDNRWRWTAQSINRTLDISVRFAPATARYFRLVIPYTDHLFEAPAQGKKPNHTLSNFFKILPDDRIALWKMKAGYDFTGRSIEEAEHFEGGWTDQFVEAGRPSGVRAEPSSVAQPDSVIDLSDKLQDGKLVWDAPAGKWLVLRVGQTAVGAVNHIASKDGIGLDISMFSSEAMDLQFASVAEKLIEKNAEFVGNAMSAFHIDSSECGPQNWHARFPAEFEKRRGYSIVPWLPVLAGGRMVGSVEQSDRFLWDFRRTIADLVAEKYWGRFAELTKKHGLGFSGEASGRMQFMNDPILYLSKADMPMGEFWTGEHEVRPDCALCRSAANSYGRKVVLGESFTSASWAGTPHAGQWQDHPYTLKRLGDRAFCAGINHFTFHRSISQPKLNDYPGLAWGTKGGRSVGINMERTNTWWRPGAAWISYLSRTQHLLQSGREVVDICVLLNEGVPNRLVTPEGLPVGYRFDGLHFEMLPKIIVEKGEMVLPSGMRYRILVLPANNVMRVETAREISRLSDAGVLIAGQKPHGSPSLTHYPQCDVEVQQLANRWKNVFPSVADAIRASALPPDFTCDADVHFMHRREGASDVYFLSNQTNVPLQLNARFRISGRVPELVDTDLDATASAGCYSADGNTTCMPLALEPAGSVFVRFEKLGKASIACNPDVKNNFGLSVDGLVVQSDQAGMLTAITPGGKSTLLQSSTGKTSELKLPRLPVRTLTEPWSLSFPPNWGAPLNVELQKLISWSEHAEEGVRHFSGTAAYETTVDISAEELAAGRLIYLDLGQVDVIAELKLNGLQIGTRWRPPFRFDVSQHLKPGKNLLQVAVTNLWPNRLIGDAALPQEKRFTRTTFNPYDSDTPLIRSGLTGPVTLISLHRHLIRWKT